MSAPSQGDVDSFHQDGYIAYADGLTDAGREGLIEEITRHFEPARRYIEAVDSGGEHPRRYSMRPWNERGEYSDRLIDDSFVTALVRATIGDAYHFCHSALNITPRGADPLGFHQDHHHWKNEYPVNLAERGKYYVQILYYPNGFTRGDRNLKVIPGSHRVAPTKAATPERPQKSHLPRRSNTERPANLNSRSTFLRRWPENMPMKRRTRRSVSVRDNRSISRSRRRSGRF